LGLRARYPEKSFEHGVLQFRSDSRPTVLDRQFNGLPGLVQRHRYRASRGRVPDRIVDEILDDRIKREYASAL
jgi:hypothetical protein